MDDPDGMVEASNPVPHVASYRKAEGPFLHKSEEEEDLRNPVEAPHLVSMLPVRNMEEEVRAGVLGNKAVLPRLHTVDLCIASSFDLLQHLRLTSYDSH